MELKIEHLSKQFKDKKAVNDVCLTFTPGIWGLLGANGAGKTTLMRMIADIMTPTSGAIYYDGADIHKMGETYRNLFGFLPQDFGYSRDFTVKDYLEYVAALKDVPIRETAKKIDELVREIEGKVWTCTIPARDLVSYEMRLRIINQRSEDNDQVSIRYLSETPEIEGAATASPRLEDLYLWYFPQGNLEEEGN